MSNEELKNLFLKIIISAFGTAGVVEYLKNFLKTSKTWIYSLIMPVFAVGCFLACEYLPLWVIGCILTVGFVQLDYQVIIQSFKKLLSKTVNKVTGDTEDEKTEE